MKKNTSKEVSKNPFKNYQDGKVSRRKSAVENYLRVLRKTRAKYEYVTDLAKAVAEQLSLIEGKACDHSTLLRNSSYKALLLNFMAGTPGLVGNAVPLNPVAEAQFHAVSLDASNLKRENERLRAYILELEAKVDAARTAPILASEASPPQEFERQLLSLENNLTMSNKALWLVLEHHQGLFEVDRVGECIIDKGALRHKNVVVDAKTAAPYLAWLRKNANVG